MTLSVLSPEDILHFLFLTIRIGAMMLTLPLFNSRQVPGPFKILFTFALSAGFYPIVQQTPWHLPATHFVQIGLLILGELFLGMTVGFVAQVLFAGIQLGGEIMGLHMGVSVATLLSPQDAQQISVVSHFQYVMAVLIFFSASMHHWFIVAMAESLHSVPLLGVTLSSTVVTSLIILLGKAFSMAIQLAAPVMVALFLSTLALGILVRLVPQLNVFILSFPLTFGLGLLILGWTLPYLLAGIQMLFTHLGSDLIQVIHLLGTP